MSPSSSSVVGTLSQRSASRRQACASFGATDHDLHVDVGGGLEVALLERRIGVLLERDDRLLDSAGFLFQLRLELDRGVVKSGVFEGLFG